MSFPHKCIKCSKDYSDEDVDAYLCAECTIIKKQIAEEVNKKLGNLVTQPKPYDEIERWKREGGFMPIIR